LTYQWNNGVVTDQITVTQAGIYNVIATSIKGCTASKTAALQVRALPNANAGSDIRVYNGEHFELNAGGAGSGGSYAWISGDGLHATNIPNPEGHVDVNTSFVVQVTDVYGCKNTDAVTVELKDELECLGSTSGFTPNADGFNDLWIIPCLEYYPNNTLEIFNRWGQNVYTARNYNNDFGGIYNGTALPDGTYYYIVNITSTLLRKTAYKGTVTIIR
jgi:gliding motility-associated-like protein